MAGCDDAAAGGRGGRGGTGPRAAAAVARYPDRGKARRAAGDPELFATYSSLAKQAREVVRSHVNALVGQAARIIADGVARGEFTAADPAAAGRAVLHATTRFDSPAYAAEWSDPSIGEALDQVWHLLVSGLEAARASKAARDRTPPGRVESSGSGVRLTAWIWGRPSPGSPAT